MFTKVLLRSENPCFFLKEVNPFQGDWLWRFTLVLFSWQTRFIDSEDYVGHFLPWKWWMPRSWHSRCCPGEACFSNAFTSVSAQAGTSKNHPSKRQMTEMKSLISPSSTLSPVRTTRSGWGHSTGRTCQVSKVKLPIESSNCIQSLNVLSCLLKIPIAHQRSLCSSLSAINAFDFDEKSLRNLKASQLELPVAGTDAGVPWPKF